MLIARRLLDRVNGFIQLARRAMVISTLIKRAGGSQVEGLYNVISCGLNLGLHLSQGRAQACLMFARCLLDRVNGVLSCVLTARVSGDHLK